MPPKRTGDEADGKSEDQTRLFGISIGAKRFREGEGEAAQQLELELQMLLGGMEV